MIHVVALEKPAPRVAAQGRTASVKCAANVRATISVLTTAFVSMVRVTRTMFALT
jgi:hypothetical protein